MKNGCFYKDMVNWIREVSMDISSELIEKSFSVCGLGVHHLDDESIYRKCLNSLQRECTRIICRNGEKAI